jgi:hypothetical protein
VRQHYLGVVAASFPALLPRYERAYAGTSAPADYQAAIASRVAFIRQRYGFGDDVMRSRVHPSAGNSMPPLDESKMTSRQLPLAL